MTKEIKKILEDKNISIRMYSSGKDIGAYVTDLDCGYEEFYIIDTDEPDFTQRLKEILEGF